MTVETRSLCRGVSLTVLPTDKFKSNLMAVKLAVPLRAETATHYSLLTNVLSRCCAEFPTLQSFNTALEELYAADLDTCVEKAGEVQNICFKLSCIEDEYTYDGADVLAGSMRMLGLMIFDPLLEDGAFPRRIVESEKDHLKEEIGTLKEDKARLAMSKCLNLMCRDEAYRVSAVGDAKLLDGIDGRALKDSYDRLIRTAPVSIYFVGRASADTVFDCCKKYLPFGDREEHVYETAISPVRDGLKRSAEQTDAMQSKLCMAFRAPVTMKSDSYAAMLLACEVLGSPCGKLFTNVREKQGLCYYCSPSLDGVKGILTVSAGIDGNNRETVETAVLEQIEDLKNGIVTESEFSAAKAGVLAAYKEIYDSPGAMINWYSVRRGQNIFITPEEMAKRIEETSLDDVASAARTLEADTFYMLEGKGRDCE